MQIYWNLCPPDGAFPWEADGREEASFEATRDLAQTVDRLGYSGVLIAIGSHRIFEGWTIATAVMGFTRQIKFLVAVYPGVISPTQMAFMARTFDRLSGGRLMINLVGSNPTAMEAYGIHLPKDRRYEMLSEYWNLFKRIYAGEDVPAGTEFFQPRNPESQFRYIPPVQHPHPPFWGAGGSPEGLKAVSALADTYLVVVGSPQEMAERVKAARDAAAAAGRTISHFGIAITVIVRDSEEEAWDVAREKLANTRMETITGGIGWATANAPGPHQDDPVVQRSVAAIKAGRRPDVRDLEAYPNIWSGPNLVTGLDFTRAVSGPGATLIGTPQQVADRLREIRDVAGVDRFIIVGYPMPEEATRFAESVFPLLDLEQG